MPTTCLPPPKRPVADPKGIPYALHGFRIGWRRPGPLVRYEGLELGRSCGQEGMGMGAVSQRLDPKRQSSESQRFEKELRRRIVCQEEGVRALVDLYQVFCAGMCPTSGGQSAIPRADRVGEDAHRGSRGGDTVRGPAGSDQGGLRRVPALARDCQADWLAAGVPGTPGDALADHAGGFGAVSHGEAKAELSVV